jgi:hypothetical protein
MEERRMWVLENRVLRRIFGPKRDEVTGEWRKLRNAELNDLCSCLGDETENNEMGGSCGKYCAGERGVQGFGGEP